MAYEFTFQEFDELRPSTQSVFGEQIDTMVPSGETVIGCYKAGRGGVVFTNKRVLAIDAKGIGGRKKTITVVPYDKVSAYAVESGSIQSFEGKLTLWNRGVGTISFDFDEKTDISAIVKSIGEES